MMKKHTARRGLRADATGRSHEDLKHVRLHRWLVESSAYRSLPPAARSALVELYLLYNGVNNGEIAMSVRKLGERLGIHKDTANKALKELEDKGFIRIAQKGSFEWKELNASTYILTEFSYRGEGPTKNFMRWQPDNSNDNAPLKAKAGPNQ